MPLVRMLSMTEVSALAAVHQPLPPNRPVPRSQLIIKVVAAAVLGLQAFQLDRAQAVQAISGRSPALPQARRAPTPLLPQSSTLYIRVRQPRDPDGVVVSPSLLPEDQVAPPSKDRSSQTSSPALPLPMEAQPMASLSSMCS